jgi:threonine/homoserine/homoserine lactone efflux protein
MSEEYWGLAAIRTGAVAPLVLTSLAIMGSPGPATISLTAAGSAYGIRRSGAYLVGIIIGTWAVLVAVATGITATLLALPALRSVLVAASTVYLVWLAYKIATAPALSAQSTLSQSPSLRGGALLGVANPKAWVAIGAVFTGAHLASSPTLDALAKAAILAAMVVVINAAWLLIGASLAPLLRGARSARIVNAALAAALIAATAFAVAH